MTITTNEYKNIVTKDIPLIDVRAPIEYEKGAFINAVNLPLMNDEERRLVGIRYKEKGNCEAVKLGHQLVSGKVKQERINAWIQQLNKYPNSYLYCFRGGLRSQICQEWIKETTGSNIPRLSGGYKDFRNYLIEELDPNKQKTTPILLGGCTGVGKTILLNKLKNTIDLEGIAHHRGSSFGRYLKEQPTQINFENNLAYELIKHKDKGYKHLIIEDEGFHIGKCYIPKPLANYLNSGDLVLLEIPFEERVTNTLNEYVIASQADYINFYGNEQGLIEWFNYISNSIKRVKKRLGGEHFKHVLESFERAYKEQINTGDIDMHRNWIEIMLKDYYDPMYQYQIKKTTNKIIFKGNTKEVYEYLKTLNSIK